MKTLLSVIFKNRNGTTSANPAARGQGLVEYALILVLISLVATAALGATGTSVADVFNRLLGRMNQPAISPDDLPPVGDGEGGFPVVVIDSDKKTIPDVQVFVMQNSERFKNMNDLTDEMGIARFELEQDTYQFEAYYQGKFFASEEVKIPTYSFAVIEIERTGFTVTVANQDGQAKSGVAVLAYRENGAFCGTGVTDFSGKVVLPLTEGEYKFRADYQSANYWSETSYTVPKETNGLIYITEKSFPVSVVNASGQGMPSLFVAAYRENGAYTGLSATTDKSGVAEFDLAEGRYKFRTTYMNQTYWSEVFSVPDDGQGKLRIEQGSFPVQVMDADGRGLAGVTVYAFDENGAQAYASAVTDGSGAAAFALGAGRYKFRTTYQSSTYWSDTYTLFSDTRGVIKINQTAFTVRVVDASGNGLSGRPVAVYTEDGKYTGQQGTTNASGAAQFNLANGSYQFRSEVQAQFYWSEKVSLPGTTQTTINTGLRSYTITFVNQSNQPLQGAEVFVRRDNGGYTGQNGTTNAAGQIAILLSEGSAQFRMDVNGKTYTSQNYHLPKSDPITITFNVN
jgi:Flp pilus assembly pilin Flp